jgi:hypothetical protein
VPSCGGFHPFQALKKFETVVFKGCAVKLEFDLATGEVVSAALDPDNSKEGGTFHEDSVENLELNLPDLGFLGPGRFGNADFISTGSDSCTTRIIGGRAYSWGDPCP